MKSNESNLITLQAKNHHSSTMGSNADDAPSIMVLTNRSRLPHLKLPKFTGLTRIGPASTQCL